MSPVLSTLQRVEKPSAISKRKPLNRAKAIRELCIECMAYQVQLVNKCPDLACPLWEWRRGPGGPEASDVPIRRQAHATESAVVPSSAAKGHGPTP